MRAAAGWFLLLFVAPSSAFAAESWPFPRTWSRQYDLSKSPAARTFSLQPSAKQLRDLPESGQSVPRRFSLPGGFLWRWRRSAVPPEDGVCYFVRSYRVARPRRDSDVTVPVGYRTCTPSTKFQVKRADLPPR